MIIFFFTFTILSVKSSTGKIMSQCDFNAFAVDANTILG